MTAPGTGPRHARQAVADRREAAAIAGPLLGMTPEDALRSADDVPSVDGFHVWRPVRGGGQVIIGRDGSLLLGTSVVDRVEMVRAFRAGVRTDPEEIAAVAAAP